MGFEETIYKGIGGAAIGPEGIEDGEDMCKFVVLSFGEIQQRVFHTCFGQQAVVLKGVCL